MKIGILSTPSVALPPQGYAGVERVVYTLEEGLVKRGHDVTVFATGDSKISATLAYYYEQALGASNLLQYNAYYFLNNVYAFTQFLKEQSFDVIHLNDAGRFSLYFHDYIKAPFVTTLHGSYALGKEDSYHLVEEKRKQLKQFHVFPFVSLSDAQRKALPDLNYIATVYNSINLEDFAFSEQGGDGIYWLGRVTATKGLDIAINVAQLLKKKIAIYGFVEKGEQGYFDTSINPRLTAYPGAVFKGQIKEEKEKASLLGQGRLLLFPISWDEPFGIVMIEAMACGTPVVAYARGSVPEVVKDGETGFIVNPTDDIRGNWIIKKTGIEGLSEAVERIYNMSQDQYQQMRKACRQHVESHFTIDQMIEGYEKVYETIIHNSLTK